MFVGQTAHLAYLQECAHRGAFPRLLILFGAPHSGKRTMAAHIAKDILRSQVTQTEPSIEGVRAVIETAYKATAPTCYVFPDCNQMSAAALNALLKVTEEAPRQAYFILTASGSVLPTLASRAFVLQLAAYTQDELKQFTADATALHICRTPGAIQLLGGSAQKLYDFCVKFVEGVSTVSGVNAFKIPTYLKLKEDQDGFDLHLFFDCVSQVLGDKAEEARLQNVKRAVVLYNAMLLTVRVDLATQRKSVRKDSLVDMWILDLRQILKEAHND